MEFEDARAVVGVLEKILVYLADLRQKMKRLLRQSPPVGLSVAGA